jgi:hypothetical protein
VRTRTTTQEMNDDYTQSFQREQERERLENGFGTDPLSTKRIHNSLPALTLLEDNERIETILKGGIRSDSAFVITREHLGKCLDIMSEQKADFDELARLAAQEINHEVIVSWDPINGPGRAKAFAEELLSVNKPDKGWKNGSCNITACQKPDATFENIGNGKYYCSDCVREINWPGGRNDTFSIYGTYLLCEHED